MGWTEVQKVQAECPLYREGLVGPAGGEKNTGT